MPTSQNAPAPLPLPVELTRFIGRERELSSLRQLVASSRLLTLTGAGGSGKSRLALEVVRERNDVVWVSLAPLTDAQLIPAEILRSLGAGTEGGSASADTVIAAIGERSVLLVLDNCEHLVDACAELVDRLLRHCPQLRVLATSREALGIAGERAWLVPPLSLVAASATVEEMERSDAVRLFVERARDVVPDFAVTPANGAAVADICARLDGIPLAIELAAARVRHLSPEQIRDRLSDVFTLLTTSARTALPRHRTLRAAIDWSHEQLPADAQVVLRRLSVFRGGFTLESVEAIVPDEIIDAADVLDLVALLVDRSIVMMREQGGTARYDLLETMRQYAAQRLHEAGEEARVQRVWADWFARMVERLEPAFISPQRREAFAQLEPELDNLRDVLQWTRTHDGALHVALVGRMWWFWYTTHHWPEAHRWIEGARALPEAARPTRERAALLFAAGALAALRALPEAARDDLRESAALAARLSDDRLEAYALNYLGMTYAQESRAETLELAGRAQQWFRAHGDLYGLRLALLLIGTAEHAEGRIAEGLRATREGVDIARRFGQDRELGIALQMLGSALLDSGDRAAAEPVLVEALQAMQRDASHLFLSRAVELLALTRADREPELAAFCFGASDAMRGSIGAVRFRLDQERVNRASAEIRRRIGDAAYDAAYSAGTLSSIADAIERVQSATSSQPSAPVPATLPVEPPTRVHHDAADLRVHALGSFEVWVQGEKVESWPYARPKELLVYLLTSARGRTREEIGHALWPEATPAQVRNSFHVTMHHLRKALGHADWIVLEEQRYRIARDISVELDAQVFEQRARAALAERDDVAARPALEEALALYRGHFMADDAPAGWRAEEQDRLRALYVEAALRHGSLMQQAGEEAAALTLYERLVAEEPLLEEAHRRLIGAWAGAGDRGRALRHYQRLLATLAQLDLEPEPETEELHARISAGR